MLVPWKTLSISLGAGLIRNLFGWAENALEDLKPGMKISEAISPYEWGQLGATVTRVVIMTLAIYFPLQSLGIGAAELSAAGSALVLDFLLKAIKKKKMVIEEEETKVKE